jgi:hypothetical protein
VLVGLGGDEIAAAQREQHLVGVELGARREGRSGQRGGGLPRALGQPVVTTGLGQRRRRRLVKIADPRRELAGQPREHGRKNSEARRGSRLSVPAGP